MKISYSWLKSLIDTKLPAEEAGDLLTFSGLEVESVEPFDQVPGGLKGCVIGHVVSREKHPDADRLSVTKVDVGSGELLNIVCGAPNVEAGQKVVVALVGAKLFPTEGEPFEIKKSKIRGVASEGMICAEDEIGLGTSHDGIMILDPAAVVGTPAAEYFKLSSDEVLEIGLTPNRADAASHYGVARDLRAVVRCQKGIVLMLSFPPVSELAAGGSPLLSVEVDAETRCIRYAGVLLKGIKVGPSPDWLKNRLLSVGVRSINNVVDVTNYVLHELGQPLHAFDLEKIGGKKIRVRSAAEGENFVTLDGVKRVLNSGDVVIADEKNALCLAGIFGGEGSGVSDQTVSVFLESACFNPVRVRKSARHHGLKTDSSFRFERGTDPEMPVKALERAVYLLREVAGASVEGGYYDIYPVKADPFPITFRPQKAIEFIGKDIPAETMRSILTDLGVNIVAETAGEWKTEVPAFKVDVQREVDLIEEVLRVYGYNNIDFPAKLNASLSYSKPFDNVKLKNKVGNWLSDKGLSEIMTLSMVPSAVQQKVSSAEAPEAVALFNPLSSELDVLRTSLLTGGLQTIAYNLNRRQTDLRLFEFGKVYGRSAQGFFEEEKLAIFFTGAAGDLNWNRPRVSVTWEDVRGWMDALFLRFGVDGVGMDPAENGISFVKKKKVLGELQEVPSRLLKTFDINQPVFYAVLNWETFASFVHQHKVGFEELPKFPEVKRDLALVVDRKVQYRELEEIALQTERNYLQSIRLFDVYEGDKIGSGKKSYALSFSLLNKEATFTDQQIEKIMEKLTQAFREKAGAEIRS